MRWACARNWASIKLTHEVSGNWAASSGDRSTFGMSIAQVMDVVDAIARAQLLDCLKLQHSHLGSQVPNIIEIRMAAQEACRFFVEISREGAPLEFLDLGGGLGLIIPANIARRKTPPITRFPNIV